MIKTVAFTKDCQKELKKVPMPIQKKLFIWVVAVEERGLDEVRKTPGFHDEPLKGDRKGQRSIRLNIQWRAIYTISENEVKFVLIQEVTPHDY